jgi:hypothetical protein
MKIKFVMHMQNNSFMANRIIKDFYNNQNVEIVDGYDYDILVCCNSITEEPKVPRERIIGVIMEPSWSRNWDRNLDKYCGTIFVHDNSLFGFKDVNCKIIERPSLMFNEFFTTFEYPTRDLVKNKFRKTKKISCIISNNRGGDNGILYEKRHELVQNIINSGLPVDIYGKGWVSDNKHIKGHIPHKIHALMDYEFSIGVENSSEKNYISEKFFDPLLVSTVPIYYGCPNIEDVYNKDSFIHLDFLNPDKCLQQIENILSLNYNDYVDLVNESKLNYFNNHNLINEIIKLI